jgi:hypothetical protein
MQPISRDVLLDVRLGQAKDTHCVEVRRIRIVPGHAAGLHVHNGPVVGSIILLGPGQEPEISFPDD